MTDDKDARVDGQVCDRAWHGEATAFLDAHREHHGNIFKLAINTNRNSLLKAFMQAEQHHNEQAARARRIIDAMKGGPS